MAKKSNHKAQINRASTLTEESDPLRRKRLIWLWLVFGLNPVFLIWQCVDLYHAPRFAFLSLVLLIGEALLWPWAAQRWRSPRIDLPDMLLIGWWLFNLASVGWAFSFSEGIFAAQKTLLLLATYWTFRHLLRHNSDAVGRVMGGVTTALTVIYSIVLWVQIGMAFMKTGVDNEALYAHASGLSGNKGLASDFLFFLLIFNLLYRQYIRPKGLFYAQVAMLALLILLLQTRTVYLAVCTAGLVYVGGMSVWNIGFQRTMARKILPMLLAAGGILIALLAWKGRGTTLYERLNPATYLESASANERRFVWYKTDLLNAEHFWWGVGNGSWKFMLPGKGVEGAYRLQEAGFVFTRAHNDYLEIRAEMGIVGGVGFVLLFVVAGWALLDAIRKNRNTAAASAVAAGLAGYCVIQFFDFPRERVEMQAVLALFFAYAAWLGRDGEALWPGVDISPIGRKLFGLLIVAGLSYNLVIGGYRILGEIRHLNMIEAHKNSRYAATIRWAQAACNPYYEYDDVLIPLPWFEGIAHYKLNQIDASVAAMEKAFRLNPWSFQVLNNYGGALAADGQYEASIPVFKTALSINPRYDEGKFNLAYSYYQMSQFDTAMAWVNRVDTIPHPKTEAERQKNKTLLAHKADFTQTIQSKLKAEDRQRADSTNQHINNK